MPTLAKKLMKANIPAAKTTNPNTLAARLRNVCAKRMLPLLLLLTLPTVAKADYTYGDYTYTVHNNKATITGYTGDGGNITIPSWVLHGYFYYYQVTTIADNAFSGQESLTGVTIPNSVTGIGDWVFNQCFSLASVTIPGSVTNIGVGMFYNCQDLTSVTIPNSITSISDYMFGECYDLNNVSIPNGVTNIGSYSFSDCSALTSISIPNSVTNIGGSAFSGDNALASITIPGGVTIIGNSSFAYCNNLTGVYFKGNAPYIGDWANTVFASSPNVTAYYLLETAGWDDFSDAAGVPIALWTLQVSLDFGFVGVGTNQFGFSFSAGNLTPNTNIVVVVEACTDLASTNWIPMVTNTLTSTSSSSYFSDPKWTNYPSRIYRLRSK
jgi:hypothetical protein